MRAAAELPFALDLIAVAAVDSASDVTLFVVAVPFEWGSDVIDETVVDSARKKTASAVAVDAAPCALARKVIAGVVVHSAGGIVATVVVDATQFELAVGVIVLAESAVAVGSVSFPWLLRSG